MKRIDARTVEFTVEEMVIKERFEALLDEGKGIQDAAWQAFAELTPTERVTFSNALFLHISDGTVGYSVLTGEFYRRYPNTMPVIHREPLRIVEIGDDDTGEYPFSPWPAA